MSIVASIQLTSGPNIQANMYEVANYFDEISKTKCKVVVLPENFALMPADDLDFIKHAEEEGNGPIQEFVIENADAELGIVNATKLDGYQLKMTVTIRPYGKNEEQLLIRASAQHGLRALTDPEPYQNFFTSLSKALFLEAQEVK